MSIAKLYLDNAKIIFKNFKGERGKYNNAGDIQFSVVLDEDRAKELAELGWNIKAYQGADDSRLPLLYLPITGKWGGYPPKLYLIQGNRKLLLDESNAGVLDTLTFEKVDLVIRPYEWEVNGDCGVKAYIEKGFFTEDMDEFDLRYANYNEFAYYDDFSDPPIEG